MIIIHFQGATVIFFKVFDESLFGFLVFPSDRLKFWLKGVVCGGVDGFEVSEPSAYFLFQDLCCLGPVAIIGCLVL